jgi:TM2 domain-containing membrane protein YozV
MMQLNNCILGGYLMKSKGIAYLLWLVSIFGWLGFHRFYIGKIGTGILWICTFGVAGVGSLIDLFTLGGQVELYNTSHELKTIRTVTASNLGNK